MYQAEQWFSLGMGKSISTCQWRFFPSAFRFQILPILDAWRPPLPGERIRFWQINGCQTHQAPVREQIKTYHEYEMLCTYALVDWKKVFFLFQVLQTYSTRFQGWQNFNYWTLLERFLPPDIRIFNIPSSNHLNSKLFPASFSPGVTLALYPPLDSAVTWDNPFYTYKAGVYLQNASPVKTW